MDDTADRFDLSPDQERTLASVLDEIIPARSGGKLPGAGALGVARHVVAVLHNLPDLRELILQGLSDLDTLARERHAPGFAGLSPADKLEILAAQAFVLPLAFHAYAGYYQLPAVLEALGLEPRPPHPSGYHMEPNDLTFLDPVRRRQRAYREC